MIFMDHKSEFKIDQKFKEKSLKEEVINRIHHCSLCGAKLLLSHISDYKNLFIQETSRCLDCGQGAKKEFYNIN